MSLPFHSKVRYDRYAAPEEFKRTVSITGIPAPQYFGGFNGAGEVENFPLLKVGGLALTLDAATPGAFKLAGAGDRIFARLEALSNPVNPNDGPIATAAFRWMGTIPIDPAAAAVPAVGDTVEGSSKGMIRKAAANDPGINYVLAIMPTEARIAANGGPTQYAVVVKL